MTDRRGRAVTRQRAASWLLWLTSLFLLVGVAMMVGISGTQAADVMVYKSPTCGCCSKWVAHMKDSGFSVDVENRQDLASLKAQLGVPTRFQSCHTAVVGDYVVEGHVPADLIRRMMTEKPDIKGLAVPGMPMGSPGMDGPYKQPYDVLAIDQGGHTSVYAHR